MSRMFGERIEEFVLSIDIMDDNTLNALLRLIHEYMRLSLDLAYTSVLGETKINDQPGLTTLWSTRDGDVSYTIDKDAPGTSHSVYTFSNRKPIWVVSDSKGTLESADGLKDLWPPFATDLPPYKPQSQEFDIRTSVMHPLEKDGRTFGVVEFASKNYFKPTPAGYDEVRTLARIISQSYQMNGVRRAQRENTDKAMQILEKALTAWDWKRLSLPKMFLAFPGVDGLDENASGEHMAVIKIIKDVADEFKDTLVIVDWKEKVESGNITDQMISDILSSEFGICYFSKPTPQGQFIDNANVLFEAGMMHALTNSQNAVFRAWIPIREKESDATPFDIAAERILIVDRSDAGLDEGRFAEAVRNRVSKLIRNSGVEAERDD